MANYNMFTVNLMDIKKTRDKLFKKTIGHIALHPTIQSIVEFVQIIPPIPIS